MPQRSAGGRYAPRRVANEAVHTPNPSADGRVARKTAAERVRECWDSVEGRAGAMAMAASSTSRYKHYKSDGAGGGPRVSRGNTEQARCAREFDGRW